MKSKLSLHVLVFSLMALFSLDALPQKKRVRFDETVVDNSKKNVFFDKNKKFLRALKRTKGLFRKLEKIIDRERQRLRLISVKRRGQIGVKRAIVDNLSFLHEQAQQIDFKKLLELGGKEFISFIKDMKKIKIYFNGRPREYVEKSNSFFRKMYSEGLRKVSYKKYVYFKLLWLWL